MEKEKKQLLTEQIQKIEDILKVLNVNFAAVAEDEINFLEVTKANLIELLEQK